MPDHKQTRKYVYTCAYVFFLPVGRCSMAAPAVGLASDLNHGCDDRTPMRERQLLLLDGLKLG
jgi:hypothetical protein